MLFIIMFATYEPININGFIRKLLRLFSYKLLVPWSRNWFLMEKMNFSDVKSFSLKSRISHL